MKHITDTHQAQLTSILSNLQQIRKELEAMQGTIQRGSGTRCIALSATKCEETEMWIERALQLDATNWIPSNVANCEIDKPMD